MRELGRRWARLLAFATAMALPFVALLLPVASASASVPTPTTFTVDTTADTTGTCAIDPTDCSLRQAIDTINANGGDNTIQFNLPTGSTISLTNGPLIVHPASGTTHLTITGPGADRLTVKQTTVATVLQFYGGTTTMSGIKITGGTGGPNGAGGILVNSATVTLDGVWVTDNGNNAATSSGVGGIVSQNFNSSLTVRNSAITNNHVTNAGSADGSAGGIETEGPVTVINSTIAENTVTGSGYQADAGGILNFTDTTTIINSTIVGNSSEGGTGGIYSQPDVAGTVRLANSIVALNTGPEAPDCHDIDQQSDSLQSQGYNLIGDATGCDLTAAAGDQAGTSMSPIDPKLGLVAGDGGAPPTAALLAGSPAINTGNPATPSENPAPSPPATVPCPTSDQRGITRPQGVQCDIGAFELQVPQGQGVPTISGTATLHHTLTCHPASYNPTPTDLEYQWKRGGTEIDGAAARTFAPDRTGSYTCVVLASNDAGAGTALESVALTVRDATAPSISITSPDKGATYRQGQVVKARYSCTDPDGAADVATCAGPVPSGHAINTSTPGTKRFIVHARDKAGNRARKTVIYTVKAVPPPNTGITKTHISHGPHKATFAFRGTGGVGPLRFQCKLDALPWASCASPKAYSALRPGTHTLGVRAVDSRGKRDPTPAKKTFGV